MASSASCISAALAGLCLISTASAAVITGTSVGTPDNPADLNARGAIDWAYWDRRNSDTLASMAGTNIKAGAPDLIGSVTAINGTNVRGSTTPTAIGFAFDGGTSPATATNQLVSGVFNSTIGMSAGRGVQVQVTLPDTQPYRVSLWVSGFYAVGQLTASLPGADDFSNSSFSFVGGTKPSKLYELEVAADTAGDTLTLSYVAGSPNNASSHVLIAGVAVSAVPEPAAFGLLAPVAVVALRRRKRD